MDHFKTKNYLALLAIRQAGTKRNSIIVGGIFYISLIATLVLGLLDQISGRSLYLTAGLVSVFFVGYIITRIKLEIILASIELLNNIIEIEGA